MQDLIVRLSEIIKYISLILICIYCGLYILTNGLITDKILLYSLGSLFLAEINIKLLGVKNGK